MTGRITFICGAILLLIASAYMNYDIGISSTSISFSFQSLAVFIIAAMLRPKDFLISIMLYLLLGFMQLPVFAEGSSGISKILGPSGGFLYGFVISGYIVSSALWGKEKPGFLFLVNLYLQATMILFFFGILHLSFKSGLHYAVEQALLPFWKMAILKLVLAAIIVYFMKRNAILIKATKIISG